MVHTFTRNDVFSFRLGFLLDRGGRLIFFGRLKVFSGD